MTEGISFDFDTRPTWRVELHFDESRGTWPTRISEPAAIVTFEFHTQMTRRGQSRGRVVAVAKPAVDTRWEGDGRPLAVRQWQVGDRVIRRPGPNGTEIVNRDAHCWTQHRRVPDDDLIPDAEFYGA